MTASAANGFQQVMFDPNGHNLPSRPYDFHPMYSTSSEHTRVPWAAHSYNIAFSDEIGHFEYCPRVTGPDTGHLQIAPASRPRPTRGGADADDQDPANGANAGVDVDVVKIDGCTGSRRRLRRDRVQNCLAQARADVAAERRTVPQPIRFSSPLFNGNREYSRVAFEANMRGIEATCNMFTGAGCTNPPAAPSSIRSIPRSTG